MGAVSRLWPSIRTRAFTCTAPASRAIETARSVPASRTSRHRGRGGAPIANTLFSASSAVKLQRRYSGTSANHSVCRIEPSVCNSTSISSEIGTHANVVWESRDSGRHRTAACRLPRKPAVCSRPPAAFARLSGPGSPGEERATFRTRSQAGTQALPLLASEIPGRGATGRSRPWRTARIESTRWVATAMPRSPGAPNRTPVLRSSSRAADRDRDRAQVSGIPPRTSKPPNSAGRRFSGTSAK